MTNINSSQVLIKIAYIISLSLLFFDNFEGAWAWRVNVGIYEKNTLSNNKLYNINSSNINSSNINSSNINSSGIKLSNLKRSDINSSNHKLSNLQISSIQLPNNLVVKPISYPFFIYHPFSIYQTFYKSQKYLVQKVPKNLGAPTGRRKGGASRKPYCPSPTALVPGNKSNNKSLLASTVYQYLTVWLFIPPLPDEIKFGEFVLQDKNDNDILREKIALPQKSGLISISIRQNPQYALQENHKYHWYFQFYCDKSQNQEKDFIYVDAWLKRVVPTANLRKQLQTNKQNKYAVYSDNNLWYDAITNLAKLRSRNPNSSELNQDWANLLKSADLEEFIDMPIIGNYVLQE